jgi:hypothetical protein
VLTLHDEGGDRIFDAPLDGVNEIDERIPIPIGIPWWLTLHDGGGIDFDQGRQGSGVRIGPIGTPGAPITVNATFDCTVPRGVVRVGDAIVAPTEAPATAGIVNGSGAGTSPGDSRTEVLVSASPALVLIVAFAAVVLLLGWRARRCGKRET